MEIKNENDILKFKKKPKQSKNPIKITITCSKLYMARAMKTAFGGNKENIIPLFKLTAVPKTLKCKKKKNNFQIKCKMK